MAHHKEVKKHGQVDTKSLFKCEKVIISSSGKIRIAAAYDDKLVAIYFANSDNAGSFLLPNHPKTFDRLFITNLENIAQDIYVNFVNIPESELVLYKLLK